MTDEPHINREAVARTLKQWSANGVPQYGPSVAEGMTREEAAELMRSLIDGCQPTVDLGAVGEDVEIPTDIRVPSLARLLGEHGLK